MAQAYAKELGFCNYLPHLMFSVLCYYMFRRFIGISRKRGAKASQEKVISKKMGKRVQKRAAAVNHYVATLV